MKGCMKVLINGTAEGIRAHVETLFKRGEETVKELRAILERNGNDADEFLPSRPSPPSYPASSPSCTTHATRPHLPS